MTRPMPARWRLVAALFCMLTVSSGLGFYNHAVMLKALTSTLNFPVTASSIAISIFFLSSGLTGLVVSLLLERLDARVVICTGAGIAGLSLGCMGLIQSVPELFMLYTLFGVGFSASGLLPATTLITRWFPQRRAQAMSITTTGLSVGGVLLTPMSAYTVETIGLAASAPLMGLVFALGIIPPCLLYVRSSPDELHLLNLKPGTERPATVPELPGQHFRQAVRSRYFWALSIAYFFMMLSQVGGIAHQFNLLATQITLVEATGMLVILPTCSIFGRLAGGWLLGFTDMRAFSIGMILLQAVSLLVLSLAQGWWALAVGLTLFGISVGNLLMLHPLLVAEGFGLKHYSRVFAVSNLIATLGVAAGPGLMGWLFSRSGDYGNSYLLAASASFIAVIIFWAVKAK